MFRSQERVQPTPIRSANSLQVSKVQLRESMLQLHGASPSYEGVPQEKHNLEVLAHFLSMLYQH